ncbi:MAG: hypothetical protein NTV80_16415 [Verrucomicrobia bacterium]|nr:hypothetical protein [Verrucomicrobiota bacterium]
MRPLYLIIIAVVLILLAWFGWWSFGRTPEQQVLARQMAFIAALEDRDWSEVKGMLTDDYMDDYGHDRNSAVDDAQTALGSFLTLTVKPEVVFQQILPDLAMLKVKIQMEGKGLGASDYVVGYVNNLTQPWFFHWHKKGRWPWDWKIVQIHNDELRIP